MNDISENKKVERYIREGTQKKLMSLLGFAARARKLVCGTDLCRDEIRRGNLSLAVVAKSASANTKKRIADACSYYGAEMCIAPIDSLELSHQIGKSANIAVVGVTDANFVSGIRALYETRHIDTTESKG